MNLKQVNQEIRVWQDAIHDIRLDKRKPFVDLVIVGGGDHIYANECTNKQAIDQCKMCLDNLFDLRERIIYDNSII
mgnify:CR=1 FL=1